MSTLESITFEAFPKIPRLNRGMVITEKIDGTNAAVIITDDGAVGAQSRNRLITPEVDNYAVDVVPDDVTDPRGGGAHDGRGFGGQPEALPVVIQEALQHVRRCRVIEGVLPGIPLMPQDVVSGASIRALALPDDGHEPEQYRPRQHFRPCCQQSP